MAETQFTHALGTFELLRRPHTPQLPLQAWDAADEYLLTLALDNLSHEKPVLVVNDQFGALSLLASKTAVVSWSDSFTAHLATRKNLARNSIDPARSTFLPSTTLPDEQFKTVLWRIPKNIALMQEQAAALRDCAVQDAVIFAAGMQKHLPAQATDILKTLGNVEYLPTQKKARAYRITLGVALPAFVAPKTTNVQLPEFKLQLRAGANVFAHDKFDMGARFFLEQFPKLPNVQRIADLGCGNGVLGLRAKQLQPHALIAFFDESYQAIAAAKNNYETNGLSAEKPEAEFHVDDVLAHHTGATFDLFLCNPPFHQGHVIGDHIAREMFTQSKKHLGDGGEMWIVGNRHLDYHITLKKIFGNCRQVAANAKFVVLAAKK